MLGGCFEVGGGSCCCWTTAEMTHCKHSFFFQTPRTFRNEDAVCCETQWRRLEGSSGYLLVGIPVKGFECTAPKNDVMPSQRRLPDHILFGCRNNFALTSKYEAPFASYYSCFSPGGKLTHMQGDYTVQVPGIFPCFARAVGVDFARRFIKPNPDFGQDMDLEAMQVFYEGSSLDLASVRDLLDDGEEEEEQSSDFEDDFHQYNEEEFAQLDLMTRASRGCGHGIREPRFHLPRSDLDDKDAEARVQGSPLQGLRPGQPGVAAQTWQELAAVATQQPDIKWLGRVQFGPWSGKPFERYYNDFRIIHAGEQTNLRYAGHRDRFGEKCMKYGSIDVCIRTLSVWPAGQQVGYHGVMDMFNEVKSIESFNHYWPRVNFFLRIENFARWVEPHLQSDRHVDSAACTRQHVANMILAKMSLLDVRDEGVANAIKRCREQLRAEPTVRGGLVGRRGMGENTVWENLFFMHFRGREALQAFDLMLRHGPVFSAEARAGLREAAMLRKRWDGTGGLGDWAGFVHRCKDMMAFTPDGFRELTPF